MADQKKREIQAFWLGRHLPENYEKYRNLSAVDDNGYRILNNLKNIWEKAHREGRELVWGYQLTAKDLNLPRMM